MLKEHEMMNQIRSGLHAKFEKTFLEDDIHVKAIEDFKKLCSQTRTTVQKNINFWTMKTIDGNYAGDFFLIGHDTAKTEAMFPKELLEGNNVKKLYVAIVAYKNSTPVDVYVFKVDDFKKTGMFSMFKFHKDTNMYGVMLTGNKLKQYSFGYVLKNIIEEGEK